MCEGRDVGNETTSVALVGCHVDSQEIKGPWTCRMSWYSIYTDHRIVRMSIHLIHMVAMFSGLTCACHGWVAGGGGQAEDCG